MVENKDNNQVNGIKETKKVKVQKQNTEEEIIIAYAQIVYHTLQNSGTEITPKSIKAEVKMFYEKFGNQEVKRLANMFMKEKKEKN